MMSFPKLPCWENHDTITWLWNIWHHRASTFWVAIIWSLCKISTWNAYTTWLYSICKFIFPHSYPPHRRDISLVCKESALPGMESPSSYLSCLTYPESGMRVKKNKGWVMAHSANWIHFIPIDRLVLGTIIPTTLLNVSVLTAKGWIAATVHEEFLHIWGPLTLFYCVPYCSKGAFFSTMLRSVCSQGWCMSFMNSEICLTIHQNYC